MKELGQYLKKTRIKNGVSLEEAAEDNNLSTSQLESIEEGNTRAFKDVYKLKEYISGYSKYLGLNPNKVADEFNDFIFEHTSKISLDDILVAKKQHDEENKIKSPYTKEYKLKKNYRPLIYIILVVLGICLVVYLIFIILVNQKPVHNDVLIGREVRINEFTY